MVPSITIVTALRPMLLIKGLSGPVLVVVLPMLAILIEHVRLLRTIRTRLVPLLVGWRLSLRSSLLLFPIGRLILSLGILGGRLGLRLK
jgi:hypothetical protein